MRVEDRDDHGSVTAEEKALTGLRNLWGGVFVAIAIAVAWSLCVAASLCVAIASTEGSFARSAAINLLAALLLIGFATATMLCDWWRKTSFLLFVAASVALCLAAASQFQGWPRDFLLNLGCGLLLVLAFDFLVKIAFGKWETWAMRQKERLEGRPTGLPR